MTPRILWPAVGSLVVVGLAALLLVGGNGNGPPSTTGTDPAEDRRTPGIVAPSPAPAGTGEPSADNLTPGPPTPTPPSASPGGELGEPRTDDQGTGAPVPTPPPTPAAPTSDGSVLGPMSSPGGPRAASGLQSQTGCRPDTPGKAFADLSWTVAEQRGREQRVAVTIFRDGFETGNFETSEPLKPDQAFFRWERLRGQAVHFWRVLTLHDGEWVPSETASFEGPTCVGDEGEEEKPPGG